ncbi:hypothetical protein ACJ41O_012065 [Fusarium nematophilum]
MTNRLEYRVLLAKLDVQLRKVRDLASAVEARQRDAEGQDRDASLVALRMGIQRQVIRNFDQIMGLKTGEGRDPDRTRVAAAAAAAAAIAREQAERTEQPAATSEVVKNDSEASTPSDGQEKAGPVHDVNKPSAEAEGEKASKEEHHDESAPPEQPKAVDDALQPMSRDTQPLGITAQDAVDGDDGLLAQPGSSSCAAEQLQAKPGSEQAVDKKPTQSRILAYSIPFHIDRKEEDQLECLICGADHSPKDVANLSCSHAWCHTCLAEFVEAATKDESLFPLHCCGKLVPVDANSSIFTHRVLKGFIAKKLEYGTKDRAYCHKSACSAFLPADAIADSVGTCVECKHQTCVACNGAAHPGEDCPKDAAAQELLDAAKKEGWQQCPSCKRVVELESGCFRIACVCRAQFCYLCAKPWKTCICPAWDEKWALRD